MNDSELHPAEAWTACSPGTLGRLSRRIRGQRQQQSAIRVAAPLAMIVLVTLGVWSANRPAALHESNYGGLTCQQVETNMQQYTVSQLPPETQRALAEHLAHCPHCQKKMKTMQRDEMPIGAATAVVTESPIAELMWPIRSCNDILSEGSTLHRNLATCGLNWRQWIYISVIPQLFSNTEVQQCSF